ncbi:class I SAM-dependent methyltransferase [Planctomicrobium sp. SH661]|uniref:tRNA (mnm(5)s(2)U34)-methyltransferase n=1 Tax=Planctomicrobium sp. SH661 TaxID=3448124 RepID=UPI003F5C12DA
MVSMTQLAHEIVRSTLRPGETVIDATAGNGHDTLFLSQQVGVTGIVWAMDIQRQALESTQRRLMTHGCSNVRLVHGSHAEMEQLIPHCLEQSISAIMFNLGYLPHHDHQLTTKVETTVIALQASLRALRPGGVLTVMTYRGHPGSEEEAGSVEELIDSLKADTFGSFRFPQASPKRGPHLLAVKKL